MSIIHCRYGDFFVPAEDDLILNSMRQYGEWAQIEIDVLSRFIQSGDRVVDAGAFIGTHSRAFSKMVGKEGMIYAFEPNRKASDILLRNAELADYSNIRILEVALGKQATTALQWQCREEGNLGGGYLTEDIADGLGIPAVVERLDDLDLGKIDFIKADLEGMEHSMLIGSEKTILSFQPIIFLELNTLQAGIQILDWATSKDYWVYGLLSDAFNPNNFNGQSQNIYGKARECGLLLIHERKLEAELEKLSTLGMPVIDSADSLAIFLLHKPQYFYEVLGKTLVGKSFGLGIYTPEQHALTMQMAEQLERTEMAKSVAEELAYERLAEIMRLQTQLAATEAAKAYAETLAIDRLEELEQLHGQLAQINDQLDTIRSSTGYKLLKIIRLAPRRRGSNV